MEVYIILFTLRLWVPVYTFISFISYSSLIFHRSISFDLVTVEFLFLFFHGGISLSIVTKKEKIQYIVIEMSFVRALLRATHFSSAVRCYPEAAKIVNLHFPLIYIFARIYIPNLRKLKGKCKFYIFPKNVFFRRKIEDLCKNENFHFFLHTKNYYFVSISLVSSLDFWSLLAVIVPWTI